MCLTYYFCCRRCCHKRKHDDNLMEDDVPPTEAGETTSTKTKASVLSPEEQKEYDDLVYIARKRDVRVTIQKGTQAGIAAGLCVMGGVIVAGPIGAVAGGAVGTALAASISRNVVSVCTLLQQTPSHQRHDVYTLFADALREEFHDGFTQNPELRLIMGGGSIMSVVRYCLDRDILENEQLERLDTILRRIK